MSDYTIVPSSLESKAGLVNVVQRVAHGAGVTRLKVVLTWVTRAYAKKFIDRNTP